jgi:16S rRNA (guanine1516-N2)-methyltransferase
MKYQPAKSVPEDCPAAKAPARIAVTWTSPILAYKAKALARQLALPLAETTEQGLLLRLTPEGLEIQRGNDSHLHGPVRVDFTAGALEYRRQQPGRELLLKAVAGKKNHRPALIDATGGLGRDSFLLAAAGCQVQIIEQEPVLVALLTDALQRALQHPQTTAIAARMRLRLGNAVVHLQEMSRQQQRIEVIYLDPMFPERRKSALVKKEAQILQLLANPSSPEADKELLTAAMTVGQRIVVKRPSKAPFLGELRPSYSLPGKTVRFDVYLP